MNILAIESSCDETAAAVVCDGRTVLSNIIASQAEEHALYGGVVPEIASRRHAESISLLVRRALDEAKLTVRQLDAIAVTHAPGLIGALLVGVNFAKGLAVSAGLPLVPVHHLRSHVAANYINTDLKPPFLCLIVSGGHSHIVRVKDYTTFEVVGRTQDDAVGECYDKAARAMGLPYPGGIHIDRLAAEGDATAYKLPRPRVEGSRYDFSFSGLKTAIINLIHTAEQRGESLNIPNLCASFQKTAVDMLAENFFAATQTGDTLVLAGGVAANGGLRKRIADECKRRRLPLYIPPLPLCGDNAAMVGAQAFYELSAGNTAGNDLNAYASMPIDY